MLPWNVDLAEKSWRITPHKEALFRWGCVKSIQTRSSFWSVFGHFSRSVEYFFLRILSEAATGGVLLKKMFLIELQAFRLQLY